MAKLAPAIGTSSLTHLDFQDNESLGDAGLGLDVLMPGLLACPGLRQLNLLRCDLTWASSANLARIVQQCRALEWLHLGANMFGDDTACAIFAALHSGSSLRSLLLSENVISMDGTAALVDALSRGWNPTELNLDPLEDVSKCALALAAVLKRRGPTLRLEVLRMSAGFSAKAAVALVRAVHRCPSMRILNLSCCFNGDDHAALSAVRAASGTRPDVEVCLLEDSADVDADDAEPR